MRISKQVREKGIVRYTYVIETTIKVFETMQEKINKTNIVHHAQKDRLVALVDIDKALIEKSYNKQAMTSNLNIPSEEHINYVKVKRNENDNVIVNDDISNINKGNEKNNEENKIDVGDDEVDTKVVSNTESRNNYLLNDEIKINNIEIILNKGNLSNEKGASINNNKSLNENLETNKKSRYSSIYSTSRNYTQIVSKDASARLDKIKIVYLQQKERLVAIANIDMTTSDNNCDNQAMKSIIDIPSKENILQCYKRQWRHSY